MRIRIDALDTLTFGVGKPSVWGEDTFSAGMFPPFPSVVRGAARAAWLYEHSTFEQANENEDPTADYAVTEYAIILNETPHYHVPADYLWNDDNGELVLCELRDNDNLSSLTTESQLWVNEEGKFATPEQRYVSLSALQDYLNGKSISESVPISDYITDESKIGIYINRERGTAKKKMLYRSPMTRLSNGIDNKTAIAANVENMKVIPGLTRFGGENKIAKFSEYQGVISPNGTISDDGIFKLYIATPAIFMDGYLPELPISTKLLTASINGYDNVGGYDMKAKHPKPMRRAVKAGSVYYYQLTENTQENRDVILNIHGTSISDYSREDGFGICFIGKI